MFTNQELIFTPSDMDNVISLKELTAILTEIIINIRNNTNNNYTSLKNNLNKLKQISLIQPNTINEAFMAYKQVQKISLELRKLLQIYLPKIDAYDNIEYSFYFEGIRYTTKEIKAEWLFERSEDGRKVIGLDLQKAIDDLSQNLNDSASQQIQQLLTKHYLSYLSMIKGTYSPPKGRRPRVNQGYISEAFEEHLAEHHSLIYEKLNNLENLTLMDKMSLAASIDIKYSSSYWADHESVSIGWGHIKSALGTMRGTVAGDVGRFQVKSGARATQTSQYRNRVRLASFTTIEKGILAYSKIVDENLAPSSVALEIARYISEPVKKDAAQLSTYKAFEKVNELIDELVKGTNFIKGDHYVHI